MLNWLFSKPEYIEPKKWVPETPTWRTGSPAYEEKTVKEQSWTVGTNSDGKTVIKLFAEGSTMTLTLSQSSAKKFIRMIEATLDPDENVDTDQE